MFVFRKYTFAHFPFVSLCLIFLPCQKASCDRPSSDGELTHENGHSDWKDQGEAPNGRETKSLAFLGHDYLLLKEVGHLHPAAQAYVGNMKYLESFSWENPPSAQEIMVSGQVG